MDLGIVRYSTSSNVWHRVSLKSSSLSFIVRLYTLKPCFTVIMIVNVCVNYSTGENWILNDEYFRIYISVLSFTQEIALYHAHTETLFHISVFI